MAKRKNFEIKLNGELVAVKHAWNSALKHIESVVAERAKTESVTYNYCSVSDLVKDDRGNHIKGNVIWTSYKTTLKFTIELTA